MRAGEVMTKWVALLAVLAAESMVLACGSGQQLVSISVMPSAAIFGSPVPAGVPQTGIQLIAVGTYVHPPATKDLTSQVVWKSNITSVALVDAAGKLTAGPNCGVAGITATLQTESPAGNVVIGNATATVDGPADDNCPTTTI
jgi:hypothetical protein